METEKCHEKKLGAITCIFSFESYRVVGKSVYRQTACMAGRAFTLQFENGVRNAVGSIKDQNNVTILNLCTLAFSIVDSHTGPSHESHSSVTHKEKATMN